MEQNGLTQIIGQNKGEPPPPGGSPRLVVVEGLTPGLAVSLDRPTTTIGRLPDNDVVIRDECVSRRHCAVVVHSDLRCELHDVASKNGTLLNGKKIEGKTRLQSCFHNTLCNRRQPLPVTTHP